MKNEKRLENIDIYKDADLIVQTSNRCNSSCPGCYLKEIDIETKLDLGIYEHHLAKLKANDIVAIRGGEPTMIKGWFGKFVQPALDKNLKIIIESNGYFIGRDNYEKVLLKIMNPDVFVRISFDKIHLFKKTEEEIFNLFLKMAFFAKDAIFFRIQFGFYSLGMNKTQIDNYINGTIMSQYNNYFYTLEYYPDISQVKLKGKYLNSNGFCSNRIH